MVMKQQCVLNAAAAKLLQSCPTLCDPTDSSLPGSFIHGIFQARILEWVEVSLNRNAHEFVNHERLYQAAHRHKTLLPLGAMVHNH